MTISNDSRARVKRAFEPIALAMGRVGLTPDGLTLIGFAITVVGAILLGLQQWLIGGLVVFAPGLWRDFDIGGGRKATKIEPAREARRAMELFENGAIGGVLYRWLSEEPAGVVEGTKRA